MIRNNAHNSLKGTINLETCGYTSKRPDSQTFPRGLDPSNFPSYKINDPTVGDFISVVYYENN